MNAVLVTSFQSESFGASERESTTREGLTGGSRATSL
jgi:hypothetical protein